MCQKSDRENGIGLRSACRLGLCCSAAPTIDEPIAGPGVEEWSSGTQEIRKGRRCRGIVLSIEVKLCSRPRRGRTTPGAAPPATAAVVWRERSRGRVMRAVRPLVAAAGARDCASPAVAGARRAAAEYQPGYDGLPGGGRRSQPCGSRGEWRGHSSGRRVVAASVPTASALAPSALAAEYQPGYDGLPGGAQGLRALPFVSIAIRIMMTIRTLLDSTKLATKLEDSLQLARKHNKAQNMNSVMIQRHLVDSATRSASSLDVIIDRSG